MAKTGKLTALAVMKAKEKGLYADGGNLYLQVTATGSKSWVFRYMMDGKPKIMGLGALHAVPLASVLGNNGEKLTEGARDMAAKYRNLLASGIDPMDARKAEQVKIKLASSHNITFEQCAIAYVEAHKASWKNAKHVWQWDNTLTRFVYPVLGKVPVKDVDITLVMEVLEPIWNTKTETATRVRGRIESILDYATARGYRQGENPARWRGSVKSLLPASSKVKKEKHHPALPYADVGDFMAKLKAEEGIAALALELVILTATRTSETIQARWSEFDLKNKVWTIPAERIKTGKEHRVPLSEPALKILKKLEQAKISDFVFSSRKGKPLSNMAMLVLLKRMERSDITVHGFRSTFRDWAAEQTNYAREVAEQSLSHSVGNAVEAAYRRGDLFEKRTQLMEEWARYCYKPKAKGKVLKIRG